MAPQASCDPAAGVGVVSGQGAPSCSEQQNCAMAHSHSFTSLRATGSDVTFDRVRAGNVSFKFKIQETAPLRALEIVVRPVCCSLRRTARLGCLGYSYSNEN